MNNLSVEIENLYKQQQESWPEFAQAIQSFRSVVFKQLIIEDDAVVAQFNPARIRSTAAKVDAGSLQKRACFLCKENRPEQQKQVAHLDFTFLVNPFPVVEKHFTVVHNSHILQQPESCLAQYFEILSCLGSNWALVYNGSKAGASAPDHLHYQIVPNKALPLYRSFKGQAKLSSEAKQIFRFSNMQFILLQADKTDRILELTKQCLSQYSKHELLNLVSWIDDGNFYCFFMPRAKHRPDCYFYEDDKKLLISPGAMELSGVWVLPRQQDFEVVNSGMIANIAAEVTLGVEELAAI